MAVNFPSGQRIFGGNIVPTAANIADAGGAWAAFWRDWDDQWESWVAPQVDYAASVGMNCVRLIGYGILQQLPTNNQYYVSRATYAARWTQLAERCASHGMYLYLADEWHQVNGGNPNLTTWAASISNLVADLEDYWDWIIGVDVSQECDLFGSLADATSLLNACNFGAAPFGKTASTSGNATLAGLSGLSGWSGLAAAVDMFDPHDYGTQNTAADYTTYLFTPYPTKEVLMGETGTPKSGSAATKTNWFVAAGALWRHTNPLMRGGFAWGLNDQAAASSGNYGFFTTSFAADADYIDGFIRGSSTSAGPATPANARFHRESEAIYANPLASSTTYQHMRLFKNGAELATTLAGGRYDDSVNWKKSQAYYEWEISSAALWSSKSAKVMVPATISKSSLRGRGVQRTFR